MKKPWELPGYPAEAKGQTFNVTVKQCGETYEIPALADEPLLVALERAGIEDPDPKLKEVLENRRGFFVTPKETDTIVRELSRLSARALTLAFGGMS